MRAAGAAPITAMLCCVLAATASSQGRAQVRINQDLVSRVLAAIPFPQTIHIPSTKAFNVPQGEPAPQDADQPIVTITTARGTPGGAETGLNTTSLEQGLVKQLLDVLKNGGALQILSASQQTAIRAILARVPANQRNEAGILVALDQATDEEFDAFAKSIRIWWDGEWNEVRANQRPAVSIGNPISATSVNVSVRARGRGCAHILVDICSPRFTTFWVTLDAGVLLLLQSASPWVVGKPSFSRLDIEIPIPIDGKKFIIHIPITGLVNRALAKLPPQKLIDLSPLEKKIPYSPKTLRIQAIDIGSVAGELILSVTLEPKDQ